MCLSRIAETFGSSSEKLDMLCAHGLIPQVARLISVSSSSSASLVPQASLRSSTYTVRSRLGDGGDCDGEGVRVRVVVVMMMMMMVMMWRGGLIAEVWVFLIG